MPTDGLLKQKIERYIVVFKIVAKISSNEKIYFRNKNIFVQSNTLRTAIDRTFSGDSRGDMVTNFNEIVDDLEFLHTNYDNDILIDRLKESLSLSVSAPNKGFHNLLETYSRDHVVTSSIENIIDRINYILANTPKE